MNRQRDWRRLVAAAAAVLGGIGAAGAAPAAEAAKPIVLPVTMRLRAADLEILICRMARAHETLAVLDIDPAEFTKKCAAAGLRTMDEWKDIAAGPGGSDADDDDFHEHWGDRVMMSLEWTIGGKTVRVRAEDLIVDVPEGRSLRRAGWIYLGRVGDEVEMPLTFKGLNAKDAFSAYFVHPKAYLEDSFRPTGPRFRTDTPRLPAAIAEAPGGLAAKLVIEPTTEERLVQAEIDAAAPADKEFFRKLLEPARRIDAAKAAIRGTLIPARAAAFKKGLELAAAANPDEKALRLVEARGRALLAEIRMLHKQVRRDYMDMELAYGERDLAHFAAVVERFKANAAKFKMAGGGSLNDAKTPADAQIAVLTASRDLDPLMPDPGRFAEKLGEPAPWKLKALEETFLFEIHGGGDVDTLKGNPGRLAEYLDRPAAWKRRALEEFRIFRDTAEQERIAADQRRASEIRIAEGLEKGTPPTADELLTFRLKAAIADNRAEHGRAQIRNLREGFELAVEQERNDKDVKAGRMLTPFALEIVRRYRMHVEETVRRKAFCMAKIAAAEKHLAWVGAAGDAKTALWREVLELQGKATTAGMRHKVVALEEEIDDLNWRKQKIIDDDEAGKKAMAEVNAKIAEAEGRRRELLGKLGEK